MSHLSDLRTLVLNADMQPLSWGPLSVWPWQDAFVAVLQERVQAVCHYDIEVHSATAAFLVPSVVVLKKYHRKKRVAFTRYNVFLRDNMQCQYCGGSPGVSELTFDHVVPRCRGGRTSWENIVTSCQADNLAKGSKSLKESGFKLRHLPHEPTPEQIDRLAKRNSSKEKLHETWLDFLYWDSALEP